MFELLKFLINQENANQQAQTIEQLRERIDLCFEISTKIDFLILGLIFFLFVLLFVCMALEKRGLNKKIEKLVAEISELTAKVNQ